VVYVGHNHMLAFTNEVLSEGFYDP
jgi:hypothetical protein